MENQNNFFETPEFQELQRQFKESTEKYNKECEEYWDSLSEDDKLKAFYAVTKRIHKADIEDNGSYRYALYDVFEFDESSYIVGMESGYLDIHNSIRSSDSIERVLRKILQDSQLDSSSVDWDKWRSRRFW